VARYGTDKNGTGVVRNIQFMVGGVDKLNYGISTAGMWTLADLLRVTGTSIYLSANANPTIVTGAYTALYASDASGTTGSFQLSDTASGAQGIMRRTTHYIQDNTGGTTFVAINSGGTVFGAATGGAKGAGTVNAVGVYANGTLLTSDARAKRDIEPVPEGCLAFIEAIKPQMFRWREPDPQPNYDIIDGREHPQPECGPPGWFDRQHWGLIAQDVAAVMPQGWGGHEEGPDGIQALSVGDLIAVLWQAVRELNAEVRRLKA
jgi:hypothetical protein